MTLALRNNVVSGEMMETKKHLKTQINEFSFSDYLQIHAKDFVVFVSGSWDHTTHTGAYYYTTHYEGKAKSRRYDLQNLKSSNVAMLLGIKDACEHIRIAEKEIFIVVPTELGFLKAEKGKGVNSDLIKEIIDICKQKQLSLNTLAVLNGGDFIKNVAQNSGTLNTKAASKMLKYHKLVRDRIPEIIELSGKTCVTEILSDDEYLRMIDAKLDEELAEYHKDQNIEELADLIEVIYAAAIARGYTIEQLEKVRAEKAEKRGAFQKKILLVEVTED